MIKQFAALLFLAAITSQAWGAPKYGPQATRLYDAREHIQTNPAPDFWALTPYYTPQVTGSSCSEASVVMVLNALRADQKLTASDELINHKNVHSKVKLAFWKKNVGPQGGGVSLDQLETIANKALKVYGFQNAKIEKHRPTKNDANNMITLLKHLRENESTANNFIIANFLQSELTGDPEGAIGHIAPVAAFDSKTNHVLIFDPDRDYYEPYWVSAETLLKGMTTKDKTSGMGRGYIIIQKN